MKGQGNLSLQRVKGPRRAEQTRLMAVKRTEKLSGLLIYSYLSNCAFKKSNCLKRQNNNSARASRFFVHFFAVTTRVQRENT